MKKLITICVGLIVVGYATAAQPDEANAKIQDLEKKLEAADAKIQDLEKRLTAIENTRLKTWECGETRRLVEHAAEDQKLRERHERIMAASRVSAGAREAKAADMESKEKKSCDDVSASAVGAPASSQRGNGTVGIASLRRRFAEMEAVGAARLAEEKKAVDAKIDAFLKEYLGVQFGDSIDKYPDMTGSVSNDLCRVIHVLKKFQYFDGAAGEFYNGKLYKVMFYATIDEKFSIDSTKEKIAKSLSDLAVLLGLEANAFDSRNNKTTYALNQGGLWPFLAAPKGFRRYFATFVNWQLYNQLKEEARRKKNAEGETLPDPE